MLFNETQETKNIEITFNYINKSVESLKNLTSFIKQYSEITKSYIEKIRLLLDKASSKLTLSQEKLTNQNPEFTSTTLTNKLIQIVNEKPPFRRFFAFYSISNSFSASRRVRCSSYAARTESSRSFLASGVMG